MWNTYERNMICVGMYLTICIHNTMYVHKTMQICTKTRTYPNTHLKTDMFKDGYMSWLWSGLEISSKLDLIQPCRFCSFWLVTSYSLSWRRSWQNCTITTQYCTVCWRCMEHDPHALDLRRYSKTFQSLMEYYGTIDLWDLPLSDMLFAHPSKAVSD